MLTRSHAACSRCLSVENQVTGHNLGTAARMKIFLQPTDQPLFLPPIPRPQILRSLLVPVEQCGHVDDRTGLPRELQVT